MSKIIELQDKRTWTKELKESIKNMCKFEEIIIKYNISGYHYTKLSNLEKIFESGLTVLNTKTIKSIIFEIEKKYPNEKELIEKQFKNYIRKYSFDNREGMIYFCCDNKKINNGFSDIFNFLGGEITYNCFDNNELRTKFLLNVGKPYIVKFIYNYRDLNYYKKNELKKQMKEKLYNNKNIDLDFSIIKDVESKNILGAYQVHNENNIYRIGEYIENNKV